MLQEAGFKGFFTMAMFISSILLFEYTGKDGRGVACGIFSLISTLAFGYDCYLTLMALEAFNHINIITSNQNSQANGVSNPSSQDKDNSDSMFTTVSLSGLPIDSTVSPSLNYNQYINEGLSGDTTDHTVTKTKSSSVSDSSDRSRSPTPPPTPNINHDGPFSGGSALKYLN